MERLTLFGFSYTLRQCQTPKQKKYTKRMLVRVKKLFLQLGNKNDKTENDERLPTR